MNWQNFPPGHQEEAYSVRLEGVGWGNEANKANTEAVFYFRMFGLDGTPGPMLNLCMPMSEVRQVGKQCDLIMGEYDSWQRRN